jgi:hypothetical protein
MTTNRPWRKSSYSNSQSACVEVSFTAGDSGAHLRDSKDPLAGSITLPGEGWRGFLAVVRKE